MEILIRGKRGEGKSTLAALIGNWLEQMGYEYEAFDGVTDIKALSHNLDLRSIRSGKHVTIRVEDGDG